MKNWFIDAIIEDILLHKCAYCHKIIWWGEPKRRNRINRNIFCHSNGYWKDLWRFVEDENSCTFKYAFRRI